jgi:cytochrome c-type biogenesis protein CcmH
MNIRKQLVTLILTLVSVTSLVFSAPEDSLTNNQQAQVQRLSRALVAPCCWRQTVDIHRSPEAIQVRESIVRLSKAGKSDRQILDYFIAAYGERVLAEPEGAKEIISIAVPILVLILGLMAIARVMRNVRVAPCDAPLGETEIEFE